MKLKNLRTKLKTYPKYRGQNVFLPRLLHKILKEKKKERKI